MNSSVLGIDMNGIFDSWAMTETNCQISFTHGHSTLPPVVIVPHLRGDKPLAGVQALNAIEGRGWLWPEEAVGPDSRGLCRRLPIVRLLRLLLEKRKEIEVANGEFISIPQMLAFHLRNLSHVDAHTCIVSIPDTADETFQSRILDARYEAGFEKMLLLWRPVAMLLAWSQDLAAAELAGLHGTKALTLNLDANGLEASVLSLDTEESNHGLLLTPVRSNSGRGNLEGQKSILGYAEELAHEYAKRLDDEILSWQMLWGTAFLWNGFLGKSGHPELFQSSRGEFSYLHPPRCQIPEETLSDFVDSYDEILEDFEDSELHGVRHVIADGPFLGLACPNNQTMSDVIKKCVNRRFRGSSALPFHVLTSFEKDMAENSAVARGAAIYGWRLAEGLPTYYDFLPQLEINATVKGKPDFVPLVPKQTKTPGGREFGPYTVEQTFSIPAGYSELEFYIDKEGDQVKHTSTKLKEPVNRETPVSLVVRQIPGQGHATVEIHPEQKGVFGSRILTLNWESLEPTNKDKHTIIKELAEQAGICYPDPAPVETHARMWSASGATLAFEEYLEYNPNSHVQTVIYDKLLKGLRKVVQSKRRGSSLGLREADSQVFSVVSSEGIVPERLELEGSWFHQMREHKSPQQLLSSAMDKLAHHFDQCIDRREISPDKQDVVRAHFLTAAWCYSAAPENVVEYLLDYVSSGRKARMEPEALGRCIKKTDHLLRFFSILEKHFDSNTYHHNWVKSLTQILQFRENSVELLSESQALKFSLMALNVIGMEMDSKNLKTKFLWGLQMLMLIFRYRIKCKDFLKSDSPQYAKLHEITRSILSKAIEVTKNKKANIYIEETVKMLDYKGTNQLIAQKLASDMVSSGESGDTDSEQEKELAGPVDIDSTRISVEESLKAFQQAINARTIEQSEPGHAKPPTLTDIDPFSRVHSSPTRQQPVFHHSDQQDSHSTSKDLERTEIPLPRAIKIPLLSAINTMGGEIKLYDAAERIAAHFAMPLREFQQNRFSTVRNRLLEAMQQATLILSSEGCIERSRGLLWKITDKGIQELQRFRGIEDQEEKLAQSGVSKTSTHKSSDPDLPTRPRSQKLLEETQPATKITQQSDPGPETAIPEYERIKIPLLRIINDMGGQIELSQALPQITQYLNIRIEQPDNNTLSPTAKSLLKMMGYAAILLCFDNCLKHLDANTYEITATGTQLLQRSHKIGSWTDSLPHSRSSELPRESERLPERSLPAVKFKKTIAIPYVGQIQIPLLQVIYQSGGEVELSHAVDGVAEHFCIRTYRLGDKTFSETAQGLLGAIERSTNLLRVKQYVTQTKPGFWQITAKGVAKLRSLNLVREVETKSHSSMSTRSQEEPTVRETASKSKSQQTDSRDELKNKPPETTDFGLDAIPSPDLIRIPLLYTIYAMGREIELFQATERIAEYFKIPAKYLSKNPPSSIEKKLFEAMQKSVELLRIAEYVAISRPDYWKITEKGLNWMKSSRKID